MANITLKKIVESALVNSNCKYRMLKSPKNSVRFVVECGNVKVHGTVTNANYSSTTKGPDGKIQDTMSCMVTNTDDVVNRIYENINTSRRISKYVEACTEARRDYLRPGYVTEDADKDDKELLLSDEDTVDDAVDDVVDDEPVDLQTALDNLIQKSVDLASEVTGLIDAVSDEDVEIKGELIGLAGNFYGMADDIDDVIEELYPEEDMDEGFKKSNKKSITTNKQILNKLAEVALLTRGKPEYRSIREAVKLIKSELIVK